MTATRSRALRALPVAALLGAAAVTLPAAPAHAAACSPGVGVTVVVEFDSLGGGNNVACDPGGAGDPAKVVTERVGFGLDYVASQPGFVCRVDGKPASDPCQRTPPQDAYWGLFWSDGKGGWKYSSTSAGSLQVPAGGSIGWRFQDGGATDYPATAPNRGSAPKPEPEPKPEPQPGRPDKPEGGGSGGGGGQEQGPEAPTEPTPSATPTPEGSTAGGRREPSRPDKGEDAASKDSKPKDGKGKGGKRSKPDAPTDSPTSATEDEPTEVTEALEPVSDDSDGGGGDPTMLLVGGGAVLVLASAAGVTAWRRRS